MFKGRADGVPFFKVLGVHKIIMILKFKDGTEGQIPRKIQWTTEWTTKPHRPQVHNGT